MGDYDKCKHCGMPVSGIRNLHTHYQCGAIEGRYPSRPPSCKRIAELQQRLKQHCACTFDDGNLVESCKYHGELQQRLTAQQEVMEALEERMLAAMSVYTTRKEQVEGFTNKTATDMYEALEASDE